MTREELSALHAALAAVLGWPDGIRELIGRWLASETAWPGNGQDSHSPSHVPSTPRPTPARYVGKIRRGRPKTSTKTAERKLLTAMADNPGLSVIVLANAAGSSRSATGERLRQMALRGVVEKSVTGRWKLKEAEPDPPPPSPS
jgi:hypothetical protein